ncbi:bifunctional adenosylcobinamide kinase/adenosylcobinamide-phosphate guanylyltransferase [Ectobacillus sp. sgz5001026]|uniref:bifunctional adenosylcobinamide kinase/adenosylcobinamide-phosphate guanylyltransferase n=1 Tax=Ectobacillus sp. sgz5001026 TaxID=3242473 RepID=UPI0036D29441
MTITYITGGVRSGKSDFAEKLASSQPGSVLYVAFGVVTDEEMKNRIQKHKDRRPDHWDVLEKPEELVGYQSVYQNYDSILVDCIGTWVANRCMNISENKEEKVEIIQEATEWLEEIRNLNQHLIIVSDEVGLGGIALSPLGRLFQDVLGKINQIVAEAADEAFAVFSGLPVRLK